MKCLSYEFEGGGSSVGRASGGLLIARSRVRSSPVAQCSVLEQETSSPLPSTG